MLHRADAERRALVGDLRAQHQLRGRIVQDLVLGLDDLHVGKALGEGGELVGLAAPRRDQFAAAALDRAHHAVDVVVAHAADGELDVVLGRFFRLLGQHRIFDDGFLSAPNAGNPPIMATEPISPNCLPACFRKSRLPVAL